MSATNELLQEMAEAIAGKYHTPSEGTYDEAKRILSALRSAGFAVVPVEPTEGMAMAFHEAQWRAPQDRTYMRRLEDFADRYKAMLKAAQEDSRE